MAIEGAGMFDQDPGKPFGNIPLDGDDVLLEVTARHNIDLRILVAETGLWVHPSLHHDLLARTGSAAMRPNIRRGRRAHNEERGGARDGIRFDDNSYANAAIKRAMNLGQGRIRHYETCHVWPETCYDERYHTAIPNLVLLPRALAGLSDKHAAIIAALQYRSFELYGWHPEEVPAPQRPDGYPSCWREPMPRTPMPRTPMRARAQADGSAGATRIRTAGMAGESMDGGELSFVTGRVRGWAKDPSLLAHRIIAIVAASEEGVEYDALIQRIAPLSRDPAGALTSLRRSTHHSYGRALILDGEKRIRLHPDVATEIRSHTWQAPP